MIKRNTAKSPRDLHTLKPDSYIEICQWTSPRTTIPQPSHTMVIPSHQPTNHQTATEPTIVAAFYQGKGEIYHKTEEELKALQRQNNQTGHVDIETQEAVNDILSYKTAIALDQKPQKPLATLDQVSQKIREVFTAKV